LQDPGWRNNQPAYGFLTTESAKEVGAKRRTANSDCAAAMGYFYVGAATIHH
jgi:hypothetical protein